MVSSSSSGSSSGSSSSSSAQKGSDHSEVELGEGRGDFGVLSCVRILSPLHLGTFCSSSLLLAAPPFLQETLQEDAADVAEGRAGGQGEEVSAGEEEVRRLRPEVSV